MQTALFAMYLAGIPLAFRMLEGSVRRCDMPNRVLVPLCATFLILAWPFALLSVAVVAVRVALKANNGEQR